MGLKTTELIALISVNSRLVVARGSKITLASAGDGVVPVIPSPPAGRLRMAHPGGFPTSLEGAAAAVSSSNQSGSDVTYRPLFLGQTFFPSGDQTIPTNTSTIGFQDQEFTSGFLIGAGETLDVEVITGGPLQVFTSWFDIDATNFGLSRFVVSDDLEHELIPAPAAGKLHVIFVLPSQEANNLIIPVIGGDAIDWIVDNGVMPRTIVFGYPGNAFRVSNSGSGFYYILNEGEALKIKFQATPSAGSVLFAFAYRIMDA